MFGKNTTQNEDKEVVIPTREVKNLEQRPASTTAKVSIISQGIRIKGDISGNSDLEIYGNFEGTITLENNNINIETSAKIKADISVKTIRVNGSVIGNINALEKIVVTNNGSVVGDINATKVEIQDGANFDGNISMKKSSKK